MLNNVTVTIAIFGLVSIGIVSVHLIISCKKQNEKKKYLERCLKATGSDGAITGYDI